MTVEAVLKAAYPGELVVAILAAYREIEGNFILGKWKASELDAGHFVEGVRRVLEQRLFGSYTPIGVDMPKFHDGELKRYEQASGEESFRILIPRALKAVFNIRNKRGIGHLGAISANEMDATFILYTVKWVLAELIRLGANTDPAEAQAALDSVIERRLSLIWKHGNVTRILRTDLSAREQVLVLLYDRSPQSEQDLRAITEYKSPANFRLMLKRLHSSRLVEFSPNGPVTLTPAGIVEAERLITSKSQQTSPTPRKRRVARRG